MSPLCSATYNSASPPPALDVQALTVCFGDVTVVESIAFTIEQGASLGLVGESGCGKSLTALAILGLVSPPGKYTAKAIRLGGLNVTGLKKRALRAVCGRRIGMVFQEPMTALNPAYTIADQISEVIRLHEGLSRSAAHERSVALLDRVGIASARQRANSYPHQLSGGMRQRAMIAMALACGPELLIADEPTTSLDVTMQAQILDLILDLQASLGMALLLISHNLAVVSEVVDTVAVMYAGRIVEQAPTASLFANPHHPYTQGLLATVPRIGWRDQHGRKPLPAIPGMVPRPEERQEGCAFANRCNFVMPSCHQRPNFLSIALDHFLACWLANETTINTQRVRINSAQDKKVVNHNPEFTPVSAPNIPLLSGTGLVRHYPIIQSAYGRKADKQSGLLRAVDGVDLAIYPGESVALVGESGCGKSTLIRCLTCLEPLDAGMIFYQGKAVTKNRESRVLRRAIQLIFQDPYGSLNPRMTIGAILSEPLIVHHIGTRAERRARVAELLTIVGLDLEDATRYPHAFSGGQRQRIAIARALAVRPTLIVADEPLSALDVSIQSQILNLLAALKRQYGLAYLLISHDLAVIDQMADRVVVMYKGRIIEQGSRAAVFHDPRHPYTRALLEATPRLGTGHRRLQSEKKIRVPWPADKAIPKQACPWLAHCPDATSYCHNTVPELVAIADSSTTDPSSIVHCVACHFRDHPKILNHWGKYYVPEGQKEERI